MNMVTILYRLIYFVTIYCELGHGVPEDINKAVECYFFASERDYSVGWCNYGLCYEFATGVQKDLSIAFKYYTKAAERGTNGKIYSWIRNSYKF